MRANPPSSYLCVEIHPRCLSKAPTTGPCGVLRKEGKKNSMTNGNVRSGQIGPAGAGVLEERSAPPKLAQSSPRAVAICDTQPVTAEGVHTLLNSSADLRF